MAESQKSAKELLPAAANVSVQEFTSAVFKGVLGALEVKGVRVPGRIIYGIIYDPAVGKIENVIGDTGKE